MKLWNITDGAQVVAVRFVLSETDDVAVTQLDEQSDVAFANCRTQIATAREGLSFGEKIRRSLFGLKFFTVSR